MKWTSSIIALAIFSLPLQGYCQAPPANQLTNDELKAKLIAILNSGLSMMDKSKSCFKNAKDESGFNQCTTAMPDKLKRDVLNHINPSQNILNLKSESAKSLLYSSETNQKIVNYLDVSIQGSHDMLQCISASESTDQFRSCVNGTPAQTTNQQPANQQPANQQPAKTGDNIQLSEDW
ncbi:MAG: hypothetical protein ABW104_19250 [Candidatus Thiodiazotropha sp. 6PLUC2]